MYCRTMRRIAKEHDVDIRLIKGTGISGRVTKQDILGFIKSGRTRRAAAARRDSAIPAFAPGENVKVVPMSVMRRKIAEHMVLSAQTSPHVYSVYEVNFGRIAALREKRKVDYEAAGARLTFTAFIAKVIIDALDRRRQHRLQEGHQPRDCGRTRQRPDRAGDPECRREEPARPESRNQ
jgi:2-oxoglutarate dehydrogenase E2 component (dihydrolipoamide succinyltransferase)